jgi:hypothetical protein
MAKLGKINIKRISGTLEILIRHIKMRKELTRTAFLFNIWVIY